MPSWLALYTPGATYRPPSTVIVAALRLTSPSTVHSRSVVPAGGVAPAKPGSEAEMRHLPFVAKNADTQVGRIVDALEDTGQLDETLIVITADHAAQTGKRFHGRLDTFTNGSNINACDPTTPTSPSALRSDCNWYYGAEDGPLADEAYLDPSPAIRHRNAPQSRRP